MANNNQYSNNRNNFNGNNRSNSNNNGGGDQKSRTGCKSGRSQKTGKPWISGYNFHRGWTFVAGPYEGSHITTSDNGREWENWVAWFKIDGFPQAKGVGCLYDVKTGNLHFPDLAGGMIAKPNSKSPGGYFGRVKSK